MTQTTTNNPCQKSLEESFGAFVEGWVDGCPSLLIEGTSKEIGITPESYTIKKETVKILR